MKVTNLVQQSRGWARFHLSIGGFVVKNCRWHAPTGRIFFPVRYDKRHARHRVIFAYGAQVKRLRNLLESGETETPRDRRPCVLKIHGFGRSHKWLTFNFTVRGFTILGCRWRPDTGSIQLPVTFAFDEESSAVSEESRRVRLWGAH